jgi:Na+/H+ antiporter NhaD/arsenite permease-like protein
MSIFIVAVFIIGYVGIAFENGLKINKAAIALLMCVICWVLYMFGSADYVELYHNEAFHNFLSEFHSEDMTAAVRQFVGENILLAHLGDTCEILFFLMGAMAIVEVVDANGGFNFVRDRLATTQKRKLLWRIVIMTFLLSSVLDNLTTSIVMIMVLRKLVAVREDRLIYSAMVILAANAGGAFSPIGDVTTIMLWIKGNITSVGVIKEVFLPSVISVVVPALLLQGKLKGELETVKNEETSSEVSFSRLERNIVFWVGVGGLIFVPIFRTVTGLPPFMGILLILGILWAVTEIFLSNNRNAKELKKQRVSKLLSRIDLSTILFFLGILMAVSALQEIGVLSAFGTWLEEVSNGDAYLVTGVVGIVSSIVDNVPLVAGCMGMYDIAPMGTTDPTLLNFVQDGTFWQLLAYCAGVGGSMLIIGSAAGVVVMGLEKISFGWYLKHITLVAFLGYLAGMFCYWLEKMLLF